MLAGIAGAIPFIGAYWVALPAVLELWLLQGHLLTALGLLTLSLLPLFFVDTLINREIEGWECCIKFKSWCSKCYNVEVTFRFILICTLHRFTSLSVWSSLWPCLLSRNWHWPPIIKGVYIPVVYEQHSINYAYR